MHVCLLINPSIAISACKVYSVWKPAVQKEAHSSPEPAVHDCYIADHYLPALVSSPSLTQFSTLEISTYCCIFSITHAIFYFGDLYLLLYLLHHSRNFLLWRSLPTVVSSPSLTQFSTLEISTYCCIFSITHAVCYMADHYLLTYFKLLYLLHNSSNLLQCRSLPTHFPVLWW